MAALAPAKQEFLAQHGADYGYGGWLEANWWHEYGCRNDGHYLDHTGAGQYTNSQIRAVMAELTGATFGNPHSKNPSSARATAAVEDARASVLAFFNADPEQYHVVFTKGATEGLKMVGEYFPWAAGRSGSNSSSCPGSASPFARHHDNGGSSCGGSHFIYTQANHKSVLGIGAYAKQAGAALHCLTQEQMQAFVATPGSAPPPPSSSHSSSGGGCCGSTTSPVGLARCGSDSSAMSIVCDNEAPCCSPTAAAAPGASAAAAGGCAGCHPAAAAAVPAGGGAHDGRLSSQGCACGVAHHLVAYPPKDNYEGKLYDLGWVQQVHAKSDAANRYFVMLDAAAFVATHPLDLSAVKPDFVTLSFYKIFGYPSGLGALLIHKDAATHLRKVYFGGGSVDYCTAQEAWAVLSAPPAGLEDGTLGFLNIASLKHGFAMLQRLGGMQAVERHVESLRAWTYGQLRALTHSNGSPLLRIFGWHEEGPQHQGGIFQFQVLTADGDRLPGRLVEAAATAAGLHLRTGCNCNPGRCLDNLGITPEEERARAAQGHTGPVLVVLRSRSIAHTLSGSSSKKAALKASVLAAAPAPGAGVGSEGGADGGGGAGHPPHHLVPVPLPLGSVRASLGALSTFEDCHALVKFLVTSFRDFTVNEQDLLLGVKVVSVRDQADQEVTLRTHISSSDGGAAQKQQQQQQAPPACAAAAVTGPQAMALSPSASSDSLTCNEGIKAFWCYEI